MLEFLTICNTIMTAGILIGVWVGVLRTDSELKETLNKINRFLRDKIDGLTGDPRITGKISSGKLAVVNVYIDSDVDEWREYAVNYPSSWLSGYDQSYTIRTDVTYNVRAIPSLYLLDAEKRVIMKDAPQDKVLSFISNID